MVTTTTVANFKIEHIKFLDNDGNLTQDLPECIKNPAELIPMLKMMELTRTFDKKAIALQRTGKLGTYPSTLGQEAIALAAASCMRPEDVMCPYYRENSGYFWRGVKLEEILLYWGGEEEGSNFANNKVDLPIAVPIASQVLHAVGVALAFKYRKVDNVAMTFIGDGGVSKGDFYEAINAAGAWKLPVVFLVNNNKWAISVPTHKQSNCETIAQKAIAAGIHGVQCDGNDFIALKHVLNEAVERARAGKGPTVVEALSYRMCDHTTADDARRYRPEGELEEYAATCPIKRLRNYLVANNVWDENKQQELLKENEAKVNQAVENYLNFPKRKPESMFDNIFAELPTQYQAQVDELKELS